MEAQCFTRTLATHKYYFVCMLSFCQLLYRPFASAAWPLCLLVASTCASGRSPPSSVSSASPSVVSGTVHANQKTGMCVNRWVVLSLPCCFSDCVCTCTPHGPFSRFHKTMQVPTTWTILPFPQNHASAYYMDHFPVSTETMHVPITQNNSPVSTETMHVPITQNILVSPCFISFTFSCFKDCTHTETMHVSTTLNIFLLVLAQVNSHHLCQLCCFHDSAHAHKKTTIYTHHALCPFSFNCQFSCKSTARVPDLIPLESNSCVCVCVCACVCVHAETDIHLQLPITYHYFWVEMGHMFLWLFLQFCRPWLFGHLAL